MPEPAAHQRPLDDGRVRCELCPHRCAIAPGRTGACRTRTNRGGRLEVDTYGRLSAAAVDPIEKKPLSHFLPGTRTFSVASAGCNLVCPYCQNHGLSQALRAGGDTRRAGEAWTPDGIVAEAVARECASIAFTYSEPVLSFELARDVARRAAPEGVKLVFVTNGQILPEPAAQLAGWLGAANVDLKCHDADAYERVLGGDLDAALGAIRTFARSGVWVEVTTLVIPGFNDGDDELARIAGTIAEVGEDVPWHVSRFHPDHRWNDRPVTPLETLARAVEIGGRAGLRYVYAGNVPGHGREKTRCPGCGEVVIDRVGYRVARATTRQGRCPRCGEAIAGRGLP